VARAVSQIDGRRSVAALLERVTHGLAAEQTPRAVAAVLMALRLLYTDGAVAELREA
jgi:hypothetical protein